MEDTAQELEHERLSSRLARIPGVELLPSHGSWVLMRVARPEAFAMRLNQELFDGAVSLPQHLEGTIRIPVRTARENEAVLHAVSKIMRNPTASADDDLDGDEDA